MIAIPIIAVFVCFITLLILVFERNKKDGDWHEVWTCESCSWYDVDFHQVCPKCGGGPSSLRMTARRWTGKEWELKK